MVHKIDNPQPGSNQTGTEQPISPPDLNGFHADDLSASSPTQEGLSPNGVDSALSDIKSSLIDELFDVLSNRRRRHVVYFLKHMTQPVEIGTLATQIAAWETDKPMAEVTRAERKRVYTSLQQVHLPKMDNVGLIRFEKPSSLIEPTPLLADVDLDSGSPDGGERPWHQYYALLSLTSIGVVGTATANIWPIRLVPMTAWFGTVVSLFFILACIHAYKTEVDLDTLVSINRSLFSAHE
ncbi:DUF7344 domain-containing protein [Halonotius roseus]|uniref:DUF308 domain-containing protein n=1 Tax=Halonotius roseus TaxID=2511997 RepID=A0A544QRM7_9EURY|nr:DUF308 domain-containing protein [Halonotius roseus]TQQ82085.1 DUF308 domain-containing protein [Halonotius roseus]